MSKPVKDIKGIGPKTSSALHDVGISTVADLNYAIEEDTIPVVKKLSKAVVRRARESFRSYQKKIGGSKRGYASIVSGLAKFGTEEEIGDLEDDELPEVDLDSIASFLAKSWETDFIIGCEPNGPHPIEHYNNVKPYDRYPYLLKMIYYKIPQMTLKQVFDAGGSLQFGDMEMIAQAVGFMDIGKWSGSNRCGTLLQISLEVGLLHPKRPYSEKKEVLFSMAYEKGQLEELMATYGSQYDNLELLLYRSNFQNFDDLDDVLRRRFETASKVPLNSVHKKGIENLWPIIDYVAMDMDLHSWWNLFSSATPTQRDVFVEMFDDKFGEGTSKLILQYPEHPHSDLASIAASLNDFDTFEFILEYWSNDMLSDVKWTNVAMVAFSEAFVDLLLYFELVDSVSFKGNSLLKKALETNDFGYAEWIVTDETFDPSIPGPSVIREWFENHPTGNRLSVIEGVSSLRN